jgi:hypothetical protein
MYPANINTNDIYEVHPTVEYLVRTCPDESRNFLVVKTGQYARDEFELQYGLDSYIMRCGESGLQELFESIHPDYDQIKKRVLATTPVASGQSSVVSQLPVAAPTTHNSQLTTHHCANNDLICQLKDFFTIKINVITALALVVIGYIIFKALQDSKTN